jgi:hypothetical protein
MLAEGFHFLVKFALTVIERLEPQILKGNLEEIHNLFNGIRTKGEIMKSGRVAALPDIESLVQKALKYKLSAQEFKDMLKEQEGVPNEETQKNAKKPPPKQTSKVLPLNSNSD